jgi:hypothetical protein
MGPPIDRSTLQRDHQLVILNLRFCLYPHLQVAIFAITAIWREDAPHGNMYNNNIYIYNIMICIDLYHSIDAI